MGGWVGGLGGWVGECVYHLLQPHISHYVWRASYEKGHGGDGHEAHGHALEGAEEDEEEDSFRLLGVGGWVEEIEENEAVRMSSCGLLRGGWVGGWDVPVQSQCWRGWRRGSLGRGFDFMHTRVGWWVGGWVGGWVGD